MGKKIMIVDPEKCTGCRNCELVCSVKHNGVSNPSLARIHIVKWDNEGFYMPMRCQHCSDAPCMAVCPKDAIYRDEEMDSVRIDHDLCIGCKMCVSACPFGAVGWDPKRVRVFKCDLCHGDPQCVRFCDMKAVDYVETSRLQNERMRGAAENYAELTRRYAR
jgi:carbon-monoxide dehydrogenase iron sulfur subunit